MQTMMSPTTFDARFRPLLEVASLRPEMHGSAARPPTNGAVNEEFWMPAFQQNSSLRISASCPLLSAE